MYSLKGSEMELAERLGYQFVKEYNSSLLFENRQASGGGFPINYALVDKDSGKPYQIGPIIYYSDSTTNNFILYLSDSRDALVFHNIDLDKKFFFTIPDKRIMNSGLMFPERLFDIPKKHRQILTITYKYRDKASPSEKWNKDKIIIDLAKYSR